MSTQTDPLAGISAAVAALTAAVTALGGVITSVIAALNAASQGNGFSPAEAAALATSISGQVTAINADAAAATAAIPTTT